MQMIQPCTSIRTVSTTCSYCALQCGINLELDGANGSVVGVSPRPEFPVTFGRICGKGQVCHEELAHPDRLLVPLIRKAGKLTPSSWNEALSLVTGRIREIQSIHGRDAVAVYGGGCLSNEKSYLLGKWARLALGTRHIDYNGRFCMSAAAAAHTRAFGIDRGLPFPLADIAQATCIILAGTNLAETQPPMMYWLNQARQNGARIIAIDPRETPTTRCADLHLRPRPGTDLALMNGLLHICIRDGLTDSAFIEGRTTGFAAVADAVAGYTPERVAGITGLEPAHIEQAARWFGTAERGMILTARGVEQHAKGVDTVLAHINLALATGNLGRPGTGIGTITGQGNGQGGREHGLKADQLPGYRSIANDRHRREIAAVWGCPEATIPKPGLSAYELFDAMARKEIRGLVVLGSNPLVSAPNLNAVEQAIRSLDLLVVIDVFPSETAREADVVLPGNMWAEEEGTVTNLEGRVVLRKEAVAPPGLAGHDIAILRELARRLGAGRYFPSQSPREVFDEFRRATRGSVADYSGMTYDRIEAEDGLYWPCPAPGHTGTPRLFETGTFHPDGRALFHPVHHRPPAEQTDAEFPLYLTTGRVGPHYQSGNQTRRIAALNHRCPEPRVEMHPQVADGLGLQAGDQALLTTRRGEAAFRVKFNGGMRTDTVFVPFHWGGDLAINRLVNAALDPVSRMPEFKVCAVAVRPY